MKTSKRKEVHIKIMKGKLKTIIMKTENPLIKNY